MTSKSLQKAFTSYTSVFKSMCQNYDTDMSDPAVGMLEPVLRYENPHACLALPQNPRRFSRQAVASVPLRHLSKQSIDIVQ